MRSSRTSGSRSCGGLSSRGSALERGGGVGEGGQDNQLGNSECERDRRQGEELGGDP